MSSPGESSASGGGNPIERRFQAGDLPVFEALDMFDTSRKILYKWLTTVEVDVYGIDYYSDLAGPKMLAAADTFGDLAAQIATEAADKEDAQDSIAVIWRSDDKQRTAIFGDLTDCVCFEESANNPAGQGIAMQNIKVAYGQVGVHDPDISKAISDAYLAVTIEEIGSLFGHLAYGSQEFHDNELKAAEMRQEHSKVIMELPYSVVAEKVIVYAFDAAKFAINAGRLALWLNKRLRGRA